MGGVRPDTLRELILEFHESPLPSMFKRNIEIPRLPQHIRKALVFVGMRRVGKTYLMFQEMKAALDQGLEKEKLLYINFEDDRLVGFSVENFQMLLDVYFELYPAFIASSDLHFYFDEIQNIPGWDKFVRRLIDREQMAISITGSSAKSLSKEIATSLRGRSLETEVFPLQLLEYLQHQGVAVKKPSAKGRAAIVHHAREYLRSGGFPETLELSESLHRQTIQSYVDAAVFRDVIDRHQLKNAHIVKLFLLFCLQNLAAPLSVTKVHKTLKSRGESVGRNSLYSYLDYFEDAYLLFSVPIFDFSARKRQMNPKKIYAVDPGIVVSYSIKPNYEQAARLENAVFLHLRGQRNRRIFYHKTPSGKEIDFVVEEESGEIQLIQVSVEMSQETTRRREIDALVEASSELGLEKATIVTFDMQESVEIDGLEIEILPFWKWALESS